MAHQIYRYLLFFKKKLWAEIWFLVSSLDIKIDYELPTHVDELASMVAVSGDHVEEIARSRNVGEQALE